MTSQLEEILKDYQTNSRKNDKAIKSGLAQIVENLDKCYSQQASSSVFIQRHLSLLFPVGVKEMEDGLEQVVGKLEDKYHKIEEKKVYFKF